MEIGIGGLGVAVAVVAFYFSYLRRPNIRLLVPAEDSLRLALLYEDEGVRVARVITPVLISNTGSTSGVLVDIEPYPLPVIADRFVMEYSCAVRERNDESEFALPAVVPARDVILRTLNFQAHLGRRVDEGNKASPINTITSVRFWYTTTRGTRINPWKKGEPAVKKRYVDVSVDLVAAKEE